MSNTFDPSHIIGDPARPVRAYQLTATLTDGRRVKAIHDMLSLGRIEFPQFSSNAIHGLGEAYGFDLLDPTNMEYWEIH